MAQTANSAHSRVRSFATQLFSHLIFIATLILCAVILIATWKADRDAEAYNNSPEGKAKAAQDAQVTMDAVDLDLARSLIKARLRDPDSAQFLDVHIVRRDGVKGVCGYVNSRNGFGGMAGNEAFAVFGVDVVMANSAFATNLKRLDKLCYNR